MTQRRSDVKEFATKAVVDEELQLDRGVPLSVLLKILSEDAGGAVGDLLSKVLQKHSQAIFKEASNDNLTWDDMWANMTEPELKA